MTKLSDMDECDLHSLKDSVDAELRRRGNAAARKRIDERPKQPSPHTKDAEARRKLVEVLMKNWWER